MKDLNKLSIKELAEIYNKYADKPVKKFRDKATAIERVQKVLPTIKEAPRRGVGTENPTKINNRSTINENAAIHVTVTENPKNKSTKARERFEYYFEEGITVQGYIAKVGRAKGLRDLNWDTRKGFIKVGS